MLMPKRVKRRRVHRGRMTGKAMRGNTVTYGDWGLMATEPAWVTSQQIEAARVAMTRYIKRGGKVWIKIFPDKPVTENCPFKSVNTPFTIVLSVFNRRTVVCATGSCESFSITLPVMERCAMAIMAMVNVIRVIRNLFFIFYR